MKKLAIITAAIAAAALVVVLILAAAGLSDHRASAHAPRVGEDSSAPADLAARAKIPYHDQTTIAKVSRGTVDVPRMGSTDATYTTILDKICASGRTPVNVDASFVARTGWTCAVG